MSQAVDERPSAIVARLRKEILEVAARHHASNVRVFGSVATGADTAASDVDLIVHIGDEASLYDQVELIDELRDLLGIEVDVISDGAAGAGKIRPVLAV